MILDFSLIRTLGLLTGIAMLVVNFLYHRGPRWSRSVFGLVLLAAISLIIVSLAPQTVNGLADMLSLKGFAYGRLLALAIVTSFASILLALYTKARADSLQRLIDRVVCGDTAERALSSGNLEKHAKPIMVLIPALNEEKNFELLLPKIPRKVDGREVGVLVIDDGSSDGTAEVAARYGCLVARNSVRRGQGAALRVGYTILRRCGAELAVTMDGDNQHRPEDLPAMLAPLLNGDADFVLGSRRLGGADASDGIRSIGIVVLSRLISVLSGQKITDCSSGYKAFRMALFSRLDLREDQFQNSEVIMEAAKKGMKIAEVPIHITLRTHGVSHKGPNLTYGFFFVKTMIKTWWR